MDPVESFAATVKVEVPGTVGVPERTPVFLFSLTPLGSDPLGDENA